MNVHIYIYIFVCEFTRACAHVCVCVCVCMCVCVCVYVCVRATLNWIKDQYDNVPVIITEQGKSDVGEANYEDDDRIIWLREYVDNILKGSHTTFQKIITYVSYSLLTSYYCITTNIMTPLCIILHGARSR